MIRLQITFLFLFLILIGSILCTSTFTESINSTKIESKNKVQKSALSYRINNQTLQSSEPITIVSNSNFKSMAETNGWVGNGTKSNPYIIQNLLFKYKTSDLTSYITILNTNVYFVITRIFIFYPLNVTYGLSTAPSIQFLNVSNALLNNDFFQNDLGIGYNIINMQSCKNIFVNNSYFKSSSYTNGIFFSNVNNSQIQYNYFENGYAGVSMNGFNDTITNNYFVSNLAGIISSEDISIPNGFNDTIQNNFFKDNQYGISLSGSFGVINRNIIINSSFGLDIQRSLNTVVTKNLIEQNQFGIRLQVSAELVCNQSSKIPECMNNSTLLNKQIIIHQNNVTVNQNVIQDNLDEGIYISNNCDGNIIYQNNIINNSFSNPGYQAYEQTPQNFTNKFDNGTIGNYWSNYNGSDSNHDGIGDSTYHIMENNTDRKPLMLPSNISRPFFIFLNVSDFELRLTSFSSSSSTSSTISTTSTIPTTSISSKTTLSSISDYSTTSNQLKSKLNFQLNTNTLNIIIASLLTLIILPLCLYFIIEYRKFSKLESDEFVKSGFFSYLRNKLKRKNQKKPRTLSEETFEKLEDIIVENKEE